MQRKHPEFIDCGRMQETQLKHMDTFDLKRSYIRANYDSCVEKKMNVVSKQPRHIPLFHCKSTIFGQKGFSPLHSRLQIFFPIVAAIWGVIAVLFSIFSVYRGRSGVFVFSSALLAVSMSMLMVAIQLVTHNTMDVRVKVPPPPP